MKSKFLVLYPDSDNLDSIIKKANLQHAKNGPFVAVILLGSSLPAESPATVPDAPTYFFGTTEKDPDAKFVDISPNYTCIRSQHALLKLESGITLAFFNDSLPAESAPESAPELSAKADVLISYNWPYCIAAHQRLTLVGDDAVDKIVKQLQPRYHFAAGSEMGKFYEHSAVPWTPKRGYRFISLGREGTGGKWFYAFGIDTGDDEMSTSQKNPFLQEPVKRVREEENDAPVSKQVRIDGLKSAQDTENGEAIARRIKVVAPSECFFCLSNPKLESHMIVSIGKYSYLTIAKGPLTRPNRELNFSGHAIVIPIDHRPTLPEVGEVTREIDQYKQSLADAFSSVGYDVVFYEISRPENVHFHIQMVPVPKGLIGRMFERSLDEKSRINNDTFDHNSKLKFQKYSETDDARTTITDGQRYIQFTVFAEGSKVYYVTALEENKGIDLQFPRRVLAFLLRLPKRVNWDRCKQTTAQETGECQKFKRFYDAFDFTK
ncbi:hypothetical protein JCM33374_g910 [Metschnikowia sp. JCM 33374]|nr:hypothetical protein JCM33374_g910 [Metschnikowia sp. JCM 33374]